MAYIPTGITSIVNTVPSSVLVGASIMGLTPVAVTNFPSISGTVGASIVGQLPAGTAVLGSVAALQSTNPWIIRGSISGTIGASVVGQLPEGTAVLGSVATLQGTNPWIIRGSVSGTVDASLIGQLPAGVAVLGSIAVLQGTNPWNISSIYGNVSGSVVAQVSNFPISQNVSGSVLATQGTTPWIVNFQNPSILSVPVGSIITVWQAPSIVGTYAEDAGHTSADKGLFILGVRNDTVASFVSADLEYTPKAVDSAGRVLIKPFAAQEAQIEGVAVLTSTSVTTMVASAGTGLKNYITDFWVANTGSVSTLVTFQDGLGSVLGYTIAPAGGGSNSPGINIPLRTGANTTFDIKSGSLTSILYATVKGFKAP